MIVVHNLNASRSQRILWLLEELEVPYEIVRYQRDPKTDLAPPELQKIHPLGKSPVVTDNGQTLAESGAILEYIAETYGNGRLQPADRTRYRYYMHYAEGSLMPFLLLRLIMNRIRAAPIVVRPIAKAIAGKVDGAFVSPNLTRHVAFLDGELRDREWFAGTLSAADCQMLYPMEALASRVPGAPDSIKQWVDRAHARPAFARALEKGGAYATTD